MFRGTLRLLKMLAQVHAKDPVLDVLSFLGFRFILSIGLLVACGCDENVGAHSLARVNHGSTPNPYTASVTASKTSKRTGLSMATIQINNAAGLQIALRTVRGGDTLLLAPGNYSNVSISRLNFSTPVTIMSANARDLAHIDQLTVTGSSGFNFKAIDFGRGLNPNEPSWIKLVAVNTSHDIKFDGVKVHGSLDGNPTNDGGGLSFRAAYNVSVINSTFEELSTAASSYESRSVTFAANQFLHLRSDGIQVAATSNITIDRNNFHDFTPVAGDHPDAIQFFTQGTTIASQNIRISNNTMSQGSGAGFQSIFLRDELGTLPYQNVLIENNTSTHDAAYNGIGVTGGRNVTIRGNSITSTPGDGIDHWIRVEKVVGGVVQNNLSDRIINTGNEGVSFDNNRLTSGVPPVKSKPLVQDTHTIKGEAAAKIVDISGILVEAPQHGAIAPSVFETPAAVKSFAATDHIFGSSAFVGGSNGYGAVSAAIHNQLSTLVHDSVIL
jgi:hypothetical protein